MDVGVSLYFMISDKVPDQIENQEALTTMLRSYDSFTVSALCSTKNNNRVEDVPDPNSTSLKKDKEQGNNAPTLTRRQKCLTLSFAVFLFIVGTADVTSDWYNALTYRDNLEQFESCYGPNETEDQTEEENFYLSDIFIACCLASLTYLLELIAFGLQVYYCLKNKLKISVIVFQEISSFATLTLEDLIVAAIIYNNLQEDKCTMLEQMQTAGGKVAISFTTASVALRAIQALTTCCTCTGCDSEDRSYCWVVCICLPFRIIRTLATTAVLTLIVFIIILAYFQ